MAAKNLFTKKYHINSARYSLLFSFENMYSIMRFVGTDKENASRSHSKDYYCDEVYSCNCSCPEDALQDVFYKSKANLLSYKLNDVICIKINNTLLCYQVIRMSPMFNMFDFYFVRDFFKEEQESYVSEIHKNGCVLNVIDGLVLDARLIQKESGKFFCIEEEAVSSGRGDMRFFSSFYSFFSLSADGKIVKSKDYLSFSNALYHFYACRKNNASAVLLLNRNELSMIADNEIFLDSRLVYD